MFKPLKVFISLLNWIQEVKHATATEWIAMLINAIAIILSVLSHNHCCVNYHSKSLLIQSIEIDIPYSGLFSRGKIFANFTNRKPVVKILPSKCLLLNRYSLQSVMICSPRKAGNSSIHENFPPRK